MVDPNLNLYRVNTKDGSLLNTDGVFEIRALGQNGAELFLKNGKVFQGGNWKHLHAMLSIEAGEEILYVGDHLYSDVLRSKRTLGWRSAFIMPELEDEMRVFHANKHILKQIVQLRKLRDELSSFHDHLQLTSTADGTSTLALIEEDDAKIKATLSALAEQWHSAFHPIWGAMFNAGYQDSRFAYFVQNYACLYTSRATNLGLSFPSRSFRTTSEMLPHDKMIADAGTEFIEFDPWANLLDA
jgi:5'-nucleotidase